MSDRLLDASDAAVAGVLAHEFQHVADRKYYGPVLYSSEVGCYLTEKRAFETEAAVWLELSNKLGRAARTGHAVEAELDQITLIQILDSDAFVRQLVVEYAHQCSR